MSRIRKTTLYTLAAVLLLGGVYLLRGDRAVSGIPLNAPAPELGLAAPYRGAVSLADYEGDAILLTFGRPSCGADCNPQLPTLADALSRLGSRRSDARVLFVSLEAGMNEQELLAFVQDFDLGFTGLRGDSATVTTVAAAYERAAAHVPDSVVAAAPLAPGPTEPRIYGIDRGGRLRAVWGPADPAALARDIRTLLRY